MLFLVGCKRAISREFCRFSYKPTQPAQSNPTSLQAQYEFLSRPAIYSLLWATAFLAGAATYTCLSTAPLWLLPAPSSPLLLAVVRRGIRASIAAGPGALLLLLLCSFINCCRRVPISSPVLRRSRKRKPYLVTWCQYVDLGRFFFCVHLVSISSPPIRRCIKFSSISKAKF